MTVLAALAAGAVVGVRHALEPDHIAAVATLSDDDRRGFVGASWGVGHSLPIAVLGLAFLVLGVRLPESVTRLFEVVVGVLLCYLGARMLLAVRGGAETTSHAHGMHHHSHVRIGSLSVGATHTHLDGDSFLVGVVHGFAGSGVLVVALVSAAPSIGAALAFILAFSLLSVGTMAAVSHVWGRALGTSATSSLRVVAGVVGVAVGLLLLTEQFGVVGAFF